MATTSNTYTGNGSNKLFSITFPYLETTDIFVFVNGTPTTAYTFANATTIEMTTAPANGATVYIARATNDTALQATFFPGSSIKAADLNLDFDQVLYIAQETTNEAQAATFSSNAATTTANTALSQSAAAVSTANTASSNASAAVSTANTASTNASNAVTTANTASSNATTAVNTANAATSTANSAASDASTALSTANTALTNANSAVTTANTASSNATAAVSTANTASTNASNAVTTANSAVTTANGAVTTANTADTNSNTAITTANAAAAAVANAVLYTTVANVAAIPASPANNAAVEVTNSTGIESFTPLSGLPAGFIGSSGLSVRIIYQTVGATWTWIQYFPNDPEARYLKLAGGTLTGALGVTAGTAAAPSLFISGSTNTGLYSPGAGQVAISTGGSGRLFVDASGNIGIGAASPSAKLEIAHGNELGIYTNGPYNFQAKFESSDSEAAIVIEDSNSTNDGNRIGVIGDNMAFTTANSERLRITSAGLVGIGTSSPSQKLEVAGSVGNIQLMSSGAEITFTRNGPSAITASGASGSLLFQTGGINERLRIDSTGKVGIGTASPGSLLECYGTGVSTAATVNGTGRYRGFEIYASGTRTAYFNDDSTGNIANLWTTRGNLALGAGDTERARIDSSGRLLVGASTSSTTDTLVLQGNSAGNTGSAQLRLKRNDTLASETGIGDISFGKASNVGALISTTADGNWTDGSSHPTRLAFYTAASGASSPTERARIDSSGQFILGGTGVPNTPRLAVKGNADLSGGQAVIPSTYCGAVISSTSGSANNGAGLWFDHGDLFSGIAGSRVNTSNWGTDLRFYTHPDSTSSQYTLPERMRITSGGIVTSKTSNIGSVTGAGWGLDPSGAAIFTVSGAECLYVNREVNDGSIISIRQAGAEEGTISVSGTTVSYNGAHLSRWSQLPSGAERIEILRGSVLSNIDEMCEWGDEENEQLNRMKVSDVEGDKNVSGVFQAWDDDDDTYTNDFYCAMTGDFIIRIAEGVTVERGDLLMSAGDGTAKPQDDDIIRSKTIAKVTSTNVSCTYEDGSYCVPCVLMAC
jgi:hypothetical protein